ncbi:hypothetical protein VaNZ11_005482 [Volvox africanus]|uniref:Uncharacterized protein n=1 Tax=Volvox africanus TaxID=51714 RepID=A0ABQ5RZV2_9CHLO|nr:hypothetical protein VaNZ11_005482 [Volvox africanus]
MAFADRQEPAVTCAFPGGRASGGMLPPLPTNPGAAQKSLQQPQTQPWPASTSGGRKLAGGPGGPGFAPNSARIAGTGAANRPAANTTRSADTTNSHAPSGQTASPTRRNGSAGDNHNNGYGRSHNTFDEGNDPLRDAQWLARASQPPLQQPQQQLQDELRPYDPDQYDPGRVQERGLTEQSTAEELLTEENQDEEELLDMEQQQQQQQEQHALLQHNNPYLQILSQAGVAIGVGPYGGGGLAAAAQAAHEVQQAALRKRVQRDIKRMLARNRAYQQHVKGPPALSAESLAQLAQPKLRPGSQPDPQVVANLPDPVEWARWKTDQLVISRLAEERRQAEHAEEKRRAEEQLAAFRQHKMEEATPRCSTSLQHFAVTPCIPQPRCPTATYHPYTRLLLIVPGATSGPLPFYTITTTRLSKRRRRLRHAKLRRTLPTALTCRPT